MVTAGLCVPKHPPYKMSTFCDNRGNAQHKVCLAHIKHSMAIDCSITHPMLVCGPPPVGLTVRGPERNQALVCALSSGRDTDTKAGNDTVERVVWGQSRGEDKR